MHNVTGRAVPLTWLLLGSQLTVNLIANKNMMLNIRKVQDKDVIPVHCKSGVNIVNRVADLPGYETFWYKPTGIANILSVSRAKKKFRVVFDSQGGYFQDGNPGQGSKVPTYPQQAVIF